MAIEHSKKNFTGLMNCESILKETLKEMQLKCFSDHIILVIKYVN